MYKTKRPEFPAFFVSWISEKKTKGVKFYALGCHTKINYSYL
jgi:hypothetical protein